jgi:2-dehydro-3-deoxy-D-arabinonate dehydratase
MNICLFETREGATRIGSVLDDGVVLDLSAAGIDHLQPLLEGEDAVPRLEKLLKTELPRLPLSELKLRAPVEHQEVWAAGVTYLRSKSARMAESDFSANAYDRVYDAARPELFFKALAQKVVATRESVGIRQDAHWSVPEPELALVLNSRGQVVGYTIGNDMSSRDIEGENLLYLPQAKIYSRSCALGPWVHLGATEAEAREWKIRITIFRKERPAFSGETTVGQIKRGFEELADYLFRSQAFPNGAVLLTGTGIVPPDNFTLQAADEVEIEVSGIGVLRNSVVVV